jgi:hypothetical protein
VTHPFPFAADDLSPWLARWPELHGLFRNSPVIPGEDAGAYRALLNGMFEDAMPRDRIEAIWIKNAADVVWEMLRLEAARRHYLGRARGEAAKKLMRRRLEEGSHGSQAFDGMIDRWIDGDAAAEAEVVRLLGRRGLSLADVTNQAYADSFCVINDYDKAASRRQARYNKLIRVAEERNKGFVPRLRRLGEARVETDLFSPPDVLRGRHGQ